MKGCLAAESFEDRLQSRSVFGGCGLKKVAHGKSLCMYQALRGGDLDVRNNSCSFPIGARNRVSCHSHGNENTKVVVQADTPSRVCPPQVLSPIIVARF